jgi:hypothetical protein
MRVDKAIRLSFQLYGALARSDDIIRPDALYVLEVKSIIASINSSQPLNTGYWVSATWISNAKKYYDALNIPDGKKGKKKSTKIRQRRGSDCLPPWPNMNADITCSHGNLALTDSLKAKRRILNKKSWKLLRKFYPEGPEYKQNASLVCPICDDEKYQAMNAEVSLREAEIRSRKLILNEYTTAIFNRKSGVPSHCIISLPDDLLALQLHTLGHIDRLCAPLASGLYNLVPRNWLRLWRQWMKDSTVSSLPPLDCTGLLCVAHGLLTVPPHVDEYLRGIKKSLLSNLGEYPGEIYEIVTADEWDSLRFSHPAQMSAGIADFSVRFFCEDNIITWNLDICPRCSPFNAELIASDLVVDTKRGLKSVKCK